MSADSTNSRPLEPGATVGFVGTGVMGASMAGHIMDAGYGLVVHNRTMSRASGLIDRGARWSDTPGGVADGADAVITIVGFPADVEQVYLEAGGLFERARRGTVLIDMTTSSPALAVRLAAEGQARGIPVLDAPVSGGDVGAREARLTIMAGGDAPAFSRVLPLLEVMGPNVILQGPAGSGQHTKMANQIAIAASMIGASEALTYAIAAGLDPGTVLRSVTAGSAASWTLNNLAPRMIAGDFGPGFYVKHFLKDMRIALDSAYELGIELPGLALAEGLYATLSETGGDDLGTQSLFTLYRDGLIRRGDLER